MNCMNTIPKEYDTGLLSNCNQNDYNENITMVFKLLKGTGDDILQASSSQHIEWRELVF